MPFQIAIQNQIANGPLDIVSLESRGNFYIDLNLPSPWTGHLNQNETLTLELRNGLYEILYIQRNPPQNYRKLEFEVTDNGIAPVRSSVGHGDFIDKNRNRWHPCQGAPECVTLGTVGVRP